MCFFFWGGHCFRNLIRYEISDTDWLNIWLWVKKRDTAILWSLEFSFLTHGHVVLNLVWLKMILLLAFLIGLLGIFF